MFDLNYDPAEQSCKFEQVRDKIIKNIKDGTLIKNSRMPSISEVCKQYELSRVTVSRAYLHLKNLKYISYIKNKGFYVIDKKDTEPKILILFNNLSLNTKEVYIGLLNSLSDGFKIDLRIYENDISLFNGIIEESLNKYRYYIIVPPFSHGTGPGEYLKALRKIPLDELVILDRKLPELAGKCRMVYQDFEEDIFFGLDSVSDLFEKYQRLTLLVPGNNNYPPELIEGAKKFCQLYDKEFEVIENAAHAVLSPGSAFIVIEEEKLYILIKNIRRVHLELGKSIGVISYNDTVLKALLDITVFSTNFSGMGRMASFVLLNSSAIRVRNSFHVIRRNSF